MNDLQNRLKRLFKMNKEEVVMKVRKTIEPSINRVLFNHGLIRNLPKNLFSLIQNQSSISDLLKNNDKDSIELSLLDHFVNTRDIKFYAFDNNKETVINSLNQCDPQWGEKAVTEADLICEHKFNFLSSGEYQFKEGIDWHLDYGTGKKWPLIFHKDVPYKGKEKIGDIKYPWELSRHQYFIALGKAYWYTGDEKYAREFVDQVSSWIEQNPLYGGVHWISVMEHAIRVISWVCGFSFFRNSLHITPSFLSLFLRSMWVQLKFLRNNLTLGYWGNNHTIGEAAGLFVGALFLKDFIHSDEWLDTATKLLIEEMQIQTHPDGVNAEQAFSYHIFTMDFYILFKILHNQNIGPLPKIFDERLEGMFDFIMYAMQPDGKGPSYGDGDDARGIFLKSQDENSIKGLLSLGAALFNRGDMKCVSGGASEELLLLLGEKGLDKFEKVNSHEITAPSKLFEKGGYCILRDSWVRASNYLIFDCGPLGFRAGGHGHADALSIQLHAFGDAVFVDPGTFAYNQEQKYRNYFRSTKAHNTITVDGKDQAQITDRMGWGSNPNSTIKDHHFSDLFDYISAENNGYTRLESPVIHRRSVIYSKKDAYYLIIDKLKTTGSHRYGLHFHLPPSVKLKKGDPTCINLDDQKNVYLQVESPSGLKQVIKEGDEEPMGWYSRAYGHKEKALAVSYYCEASGEVYMCSLVIPYGENVPEINTFKLHNEKQSIIVEVEKNDKKDFWIINESPSECRFKEITFNGTIAMIRQDNEGELVFAYGKDSSYFSFKGKPYFESSAPINGFLNNP